MRNILFTSESVTEGHPDKVCDKVSDAVLDALLAIDPMSRVACETFATTDKITVMGEITTKAKVDYESIIRKTISDIGYNTPDIGFDAATCSVTVDIHEQSPDIAMGVDLCAEAKAGDKTDGLDTGAGDQGMMFGYACTETPELMPLPIALAHRLALRLTEVRKNGTLTYLRPDGKTQVSVLYENGTPVHVDTVVVSTQHSADVSVEQIREDMIKYVIRPIIGDKLMDDQTRIFVNPTGRFVVGGPAGDTGLTGRKIIVDTYGGMCGHGGGAFSGKDPTKVDRSASYAARYVAKNIVAAGLADRCQVQIAYAIGVAHPVSVNVDTFGTAKVDEAKIEEKVKELFDLRPAAIIRDLNLRTVRYSPLAAYGHMGREDVAAPWEKTDRKEALAALLH